MKTFVLLFLLLVSLALGQNAPTGRPYVRYAQFIEDTQVELTDGSRWAMDKGDCFPIYMFKDQQKRVVLQLGEAKFTTDTARTRIMDENEEAAALESYNKNLQNLAEAKARKEKAAAGAQ